MGHQSGCLSAALLLDLRAKPHLFREVSDGSLIIKFAAGPRMAASDHVREPIFWSILSWSSVFSHAPAKFSHHTWWPPAIYFHRRMSR
jgi:hypothetical protein